MEGAPVPAQSRLQQAHRLADAGQLAEAAVICAELLRDNPDCAPAHYLQGLLRDATGDPAAIGCYRKALYLDPNHYHALLQMALLARKSGDAAAAANYKRRAAQAHQAPDPRVAPAKRRPASASLHPPAHDPGRPIAASCPDSANPPAAPAFEA
jgi:tetratricopeptide (TPR) repeat protein